MTTNIKMPKAYYDYLLSTDGRLTSLDVRIFYRIETKKEVKKILYTKK